MLAKPRMMERVVPTIKIEHRYPSRRILLSMSRLGDVKEKGENRVDGSSSSSVNGPGS